MKKKNSKKIFLIKIFLILFCVFSIFFVVKNTISKYETKAKATGNVQAAMYIVKEGYQTMNINLGSLVPRSEPYEYIFSISNYDGTNRAEVNLQYDLKIVTTTNLNLSYELYLNDGTDNIILTDNIEADEDGTYFKNMTTETKSFGFDKDEMNVYKLVVYFPEIYKDIKYQDIIEGVEIQVNSKQIIN